jgi:hypothetical protein
MNQVITEYQVSVCVYFFVGPIILLIICLQLKTITKYSLTF